MFDDLAKPGVGMDKNSNRANFPESQNYGFGQAPNKKAVIEDILADSSDFDRDKPEAFRPKPAETEEIASAEATAPDPSAKIKKIFTLLVIMAGLAAIIILGYFGYKTFLADNTASINTSVENKTEAVATPAPNTPTPSAEEPIAAPDEPESPSVPVTEPTLDTDHDGLMDTEEAQLGTDINNVDSDNDGLFDREEAKVYKTNPLLPDTDGDGYTDGAEVKGGYNPNGEGKLYEVNQ